MKALRTPPRRGAFHVDWLAAKVGAVVKNRPQTFNKPDQAASWRQQSPRRVVLPLHLLLDDPGKQPNWLVLQ
jgi:hypothetical protein